MNCRPQQRLKQLSTLFFAAPLGYWGCDSHQAHLALPACAVVVLLSAERRLVGTHLSLSSLAPVLG
jgi:hypothetical protein